MALHCMGAEIPVPSQGLPIGLGGGGSGVKGLRSDKGLSPSFQLQTKDHLLPPSPPPELPAVVLVTGAALGLPKPPPPSPIPHGGLPVLPQAHYRLQTAEDELESGPASLLCQNPTFQCQGQTGQTMGSSLP